MPELVKAQKWKPKKSIPKQIRKKVYQSNDWKQLRLSYLKKHPLCELCLLEGKIIPAVDVHHKCSITIDRSKAFDYNNLMALCKKHHAELHKNGATKGFNLQKWKLDHKL